MVVCSTTDIQKFFRFVFTCDTYQKKVLVNVHRSRLWWFGIHKNLQVPWYLVVLLAQHNGIFLYWSSRWACPPYPNNLDTHAGEILGGILAYSYRT